MLTVWREPALLPASGEEPGAVLMRCAPVTDERGAQYIAKRRVPMEVAVASGVSFCPDFAGRPAVIAPMVDYGGRLVAITGRYTVGGNAAPKILTFGRAGGVFPVLDGLRAEPLMLVEGVFDALSLASCGVPAVATIGRYISWMPQHAASRNVLLGFDANRVGDHAARYYAEHLAASNCERLRPPAGCKDWNAVLKKRGESFLREWLSRQDAIAPQEGAW